jgi:hypothetical protein
MAPITCPCSLPAERVDLIAVIAGTFIIERLKRLATM